MGQTDSFGDDMPEYQKKKRASRSELKALLQAQQYCCALSGLPLTPENAELDHRDPVSHGGSSAVGNLQWLHRDVNRMKSTMKNERFIALCRLVSSSDDGSGEEHF